MDKENKTKKRYFIVLDYGVGGVSFNKNWNKKDALSFAKSMSKDNAHNSKVYEAEFIKGFDAEIKLIDDEDDDWT